MTYAFDGLLLSYQNSEVAQEYAAQAIFGGIGVNGNSQFPMFIFR